MYDLPAKMQDGDINLKGFGTTEYVQRWISGDFIGGDMVDKPTRPYAQVIWVYRSIRLLCNSAKMLSLRMSRKGSDREDIVESGPAFNWWSADRQMVTELINDTIGHKQLTGECHWIAEGRKDKTSIAHVVGRHQMGTKLNNDNTELLFWILKDGHKSVKLDERDLYQDIDWSPYDKFRGISPLDAGTLSISVDYQSSKHNEQNLSNNAEPAGILSTDQELDPEDAKEIQRFWSQNHQGSSNRGKPGITWGGLKWQQTASNLRDMLFDKVKMMTANEIVSGCFGIPPVMVGINKDSNYGFADAGRKIFWSDVMPTIVLDFNELATRFTNDRIDPNVDVWLDMNDSPVYSEMQQEKYKLVKPLLEAGATWNDVNEKLKLGFQENEWGDESWVNQSQVPRRFILEGEFDEPEAPPQAPEQEPEPTPDELEEERQFKALDAKRSRIWRAWANSWNPLRRSVDRKLRGYLNKWEKEMMGRLAKVDSDQKLSPVDLSPSTIDLTELLGPQAAKDKELQGILGPMIERGVEFGVKQAAHELGAEVTADFSQVNARIRHVINRKVIKLVELNKTIRDQVRKQVKQAIVQSVEKNETVTERAARVQKALKGSMRQTRGRALTISRTEMAQSVSTGRHRVYEHVGVAKHMWISARDENVRDTHVEAERQYGSKDTAISIHSKFQVGNALLSHPADPSGPPEEIINCRCVEIAVREKDGRDVTLDFYLNKGFLQWTEH